MLFKRKNRKQIAAKGNAKCPSFPKPKCYVLSNGALVFDVSLILCTGKWTQLLTETVLAFNLNF
jgi:hypothetical protein